MEEPKMKAWLPNAVIVNFYGSITSIKWEDETVYPFILNNLNKYLDAHWNELFLMELISNFRVESIEHRFKYEHEDAPIVADDDNDAVVKQTLIDYIKWQMGKKKETRSTIAVQRQIWQNGFNTGELKTHVFEDVKTAFEMWTSELKIKIYIYSSMDVDDMKLLLSKTTAGDLTALVTGYFDQTKVKNKYDEILYKQYANTINEKPNRVLVITHIGKDAKAASEAGMESVLVLRYGNAKIRDYYEAKFDSIDSLVDLQFVKPED